MHFLLLPQDFSVCKLSDDATPDLSAGITFFAKTDDEVSLVCETRSAPHATITCEHGWRLLKIAEILDFSLVGILAEIASILASGKISIFAISTYNTDYILVRQEQLEKTLNILQSNGHTLTTG